MDIRKLDKGQMFMKFRETDMVGFIDDLMQTFEYLFHLHLYSRTVARLAGYLDFSNLGLINLNCLASVSYTHLDVYKRQTTMFLRWKTSR